MKPDGRIQVVPERKLKLGDKVALGRSENGEEGVLVWADGFVQDEVESGDRFSFRSVRSRETSYARDYDRLVELLEHDRENGNILWVMGPAFTFDADARHAMQRLVECGYVDGVMGGNALATHDLEGSYLHKHGKYWYLFVSSGNFGDHTYQLKVGRAKKLTDDFVDREGKPMKEGFATTILHSDEGDDFYGPGHCGEIFKAKDGNEYIFYHCHVAGSRRPGSRPLFVSQIKWDAEGWPYVEGGKPK